MPYNVHDIADKIILRTDTERGDIISNLKLQKLLYYMQGYHLAFFGNKFFDADLVAWTYGPVVPDVYHRFKENGAFGIVLDSTQHEHINLSDEEEDMFSQVLAEYGKFSAIRLMEMTHQETPWKEATDTEEKIIDTETMRSFFTKLIDE